MDRRGERKRERERERGDRETTGYEPFEQQREGLATCAKAESDWSSKMKSVDAVPFGNGTW